MAFALLAVSCEKTTEGLTGITYYPVITVNGDAGVIYVGETYEDPGCTAIMNGEDITDQVIVTDNINNQVPGIYSVTYSATNEQGFSASASRTVYVAAESGIVNLYVGEMWTPKGSYLSGGTHLITDNGDGTYQMDDIMGGYYCWYTYPGYQAIYCICRLLGAALGCGIILLFHSGGIAAQGPCFDHSDRCSG